MGKSKGVETVSYKYRLRESIGWFNYFVGLFLIISLIIGSWIACMVIAGYISISFYRSYCNSRVYIYDIKEREYIVEVLYFDKHISKKLVFEKKHLKIDLIDDGYANHLRFYCKSKLILKHYPIGYWTKEMLSKYYENYCKGMYEV